MKEISIKDFIEVGIGQVENTEGGTGLTAIISRTGMFAGVDIRGGGPASRETPLLNPLMANNKIHGIVLSGGSAFGLGAANGVMECLRENGIGYDVRGTLVPLVVQADIFDLKIGENTFPDPKMGYAATEIALTNPNYRDGNYGAGCGATVGKIKGMNTAMKAGIGSYAVDINGVKIGAIAVVNAFGDIYDWRTGKQIAGLRSDDGSSLESSLEYMKNNLFGDSSEDENDYAGNTTLGVILTNASFSKAELCKIAGMAHDGYSRSINPVHTTKDGDSIFAASVGNITADMNAVGSIAAEVMSEAITNAIKSAESAFGCISYSELRRLP